MAQYRKKPVVIEARQFANWSSAIEIMTWATDVYLVPAGAEHPLRRESEHDASNGHVYEENAPAFLVVKTLEGPMRADEEHWIIRGVAGEFYPCKPDIFEETYEPVEETP